MTLKRGRSFGKYRIEGKLAEGGFAAVYKAYDTIEGIRVALKVPHGSLVDKEMLELFRREVRVNAQLDHPSILPIKYAGFIDGKFVIVYPLGRETLEDRLARRLTVPKAMDWAEQMLEAVAFAHRKRILHSDVKPENFILFDGERLRLADFGLAKVSHHTVSASGSGTVGYLAPEQAMGKPSLRSDVFSLGLILYRMLTGVLPEWPYEWPTPGAERLRQRTHAEMVALVRKAIEVDHRRRFRDADQMLAALRRIKPKVLARAAGRRRRRRKTVDSALQWKTMRFREFRAKHGAKLETRFDCRRCGGPISEPMHACPWCGVRLATHRGETRYPARCTRCRRGRKLDWRFCPWCYGGVFRKVSSREYSDRRYEARCSNPACKARRLMPFMRYCPSCNRRVKRRWKMPGSADPCPRCGWGVLRQFWDYCPWCARGLARK